MKRPQKFCLNFWGLFKLELLFNLLLTVVAIHRAVDADRCE